MEKHRLNREKGKLKSTIGLGISNDRFCFRGGWFCWRWTAQEAWKDGVETATERQQRGCTKEIWDDHWCRSSDPHCLTAAACTEERVPMLLSTSLSSLEKKGPLGPPSFSSLPLGDFVVGLRFLFYLLYNNE
jgi:hypothetical protein